MFRVKCTPDTIEDIREEIMELMSNYLKECDGYRLLLLQQTYQRQGNSED